MDRLHHYTALRITCNKTVLSQQFLVRMHVYMPRCCLAFILKDCVAFPVASSVTKNVFDIVHHAKESKRLLNV
jgi:hypothetical protein